MSRSEVKSEGSPLVQALRRVVLAAATARALEVVYYNNVLETMRNHSYVATLVDRDSGRGADDAAPVEPGIPAQDRC